MTPRNPIVRSVLIPLTLASALLAGSAHGADGVPSLEAPGPVATHVQQVLDEIGVTADQRAAIRDIVEDARAQFAEIRAEREALREEGLDLWSAPTLDADAIEAHRESLVSLFDRGTQIGTDAIVGVGDVLTQEQRQAIAERIRAFHESGGLRARIHAHLHGEG